MKGECILLNPKFSGTISSLRRPSAYWVNILSADLGGRVGWLLKAERVKISSFLLAMRGVGGGGRGGMPASFPSRSPPPKQPFQKIVIAEEVFVGKRPQAPGRPGPKPWGPGPQAPWRPGPQAPGAWIPPLSPIDFLPSF